MYHRHFGLSGPPFQFTPAPDALYLSATHRETLALLEWGLLHEPTGFTMLVGESGVGKTTLVASILARRLRNVRTALLTNPRLDFDQIMQVAMSQLAPGWSGQTRLELTEGFAELLDALAPGERVAIVIDEAHELSDDALEGLRLLSNADTFEERRLQIILVGQPELITRLARPAMRSLNQRIGARAVLRSLGPDEAREYIDCRLRAKGGTVGKIFAPAALACLIAHSGGIPRRLNVLSHNSMLQGYAAGSKKVSLAMVRNAVGEYEDLLKAKGARGSTDGPPRAAKPGISLTRVALAATALLLAVAGALLVWSQGWVAFNSSHATSDGGMAVQPAADPYWTGPGTPLLPVASTVGDSPFDVTLRAAQAAAAAATGKTAVVH
ncbi:MAG TPA: AAA family ATPase [Candidatus Binataceae bacterium]|nr:AAA family ATPase [Candidatus Binataceae bacterium]